MPTRWLNNHVKVYR